LNSKNDYEKRTRRFNVRFTESEYNNLKDFVDTKTNYKLSEFIREAIKIYREKIENPTQTNNVGVSKEILKMFKRLEENQKQIMNDQKSEAIIHNEMKEKLNNINGNL